MLEEKRKNNLLGDMWICIKFMSWDLLMLFVYWVRVKLIEKNYCF